MNPIVILIAAGYGYLSGNPKARKDFFALVQKMTNKGIDALNNMGGGADVPKTDDVTIPNEE